jgi:hypothetical protein
MGLFCFCCLNPVIFPVRSPFHCQTSHQPPITAAKSHFSKPEFCGCRKKVPPVVRANFERLVFASPLPVIPGWPLAGLAAHVAGPRVRVRTVAVIAAMLARTFDSSTSSAHWQPLRLRLALHTSARSRAMIEAKEPPRSSPSLINRKPCRAMSLVVTVAGSILIIGYAWCYLLAPTSFGRELM